MTTTRAALPQIHTYDHVVMDIEGTTTSISFVTSVLFPYVLEKIEDHLQATCREEQTHRDVDALRDQTEADVSEGEIYKDAPRIPHWDAPGTCESDVLSAVVENVKWNMSLDRKMAALKALQGHMWRSGYESGLIKGHLYEDVPIALDQWKKMGKHLFIYSSGSAQAQKLLFGYSVAGDLNGDIEGNYDTVFPGSKLDAESYRKIARDISSKTAVEQDQIASRILFLTDNIMEALAAREAGIGHVVLSVREGTKPLPDDHDFPVITSFDMLFN